MPIDWIVWSPAKVAELQKLWAAGYPTEEIGRRMNVSKSAIVGKAHRLHLPPRKSPIIHTPPKTPELPTAIAPERRALPPVPLPAGSPLSWGLISNLEWPGP